MRALPLLPLLFATALGWGCEEDTLTEDCCAPTRAEAEIERYCSNRCDCKGCADGDYDKCVQDFASFGDSVQDQGCTGFDDHLACINEHVVCENGDYEVPEPEEDVCQDILNQSCG